MCKWVCLGNVHFYNTRYRIAPHGFLCLPRAHPRQCVVPEWTQAAGGRQKPPLRPLAAPHKPSQATEVHRCTTVGAAATTPLAPRSQPRRHAGGADGPGRGARLASAAARRSRCTRALQLPKRPAKHDTQPGHAAGSCGVKARAWDHASGRARCRMDRLTRLGRAGVVRARCGECTPAMPKLGPYADALGRAGAPRRGTRCGRCGSRTTALIGGYHTA